MLLKFYATLHSLVCYIATLLSFVIFPYSLLFPDSNNCKEVIGKEGLRVLIGALDSSSEELQIWTAQTIQSLCTGTGVYFYLFLLL